MSINFNFNLDIFDESQPSSSEGATPNSSINNSLSLGGSYSRSNSGGVSFNTPRSLLALDSLSHFPEFNFSNKQNIWSTSYTNANPLHKLPSFLSEERVDKENKPDIEISPKQPVIVHPTPKHVATVIDNLFPQMNKPPLASLFTSMKPSSQLVSQVGLNSFRSYLGTQFKVQENSKFFVIKSYNIMDVNASFINGIWSSTEMGNKRLGKAYATASLKDADIYLFFLVNGSGKFCGVARMTSGVDYERSSDIWSETSRWKGIFEVEWLLVKDVPNKYFHHLKIPTNENKPVTNSRDTQEVPFDTALSMLKIITGFKTSNSFLI